MANTELLRKVLQHIKNNPDQFDAVRWHKDFAGWTLRLAVPGVGIKEVDGVERLVDADGENIWITDIGTRAKELLGLKPSQASRLFCAANTVADLERYVAEFTEPASPSDQVPAITPHVCQHVACDHAAVRPVPAWAKPEATA